MKRYPRTLADLGLRIEDASSHFWLIGTTGSGKSTVLRIFTVDLLNHGFGCVWCCVKGDEADSAVAVIESTVMRDRLLRLRLGEFTFNFVVFELTRPGGSSASLARLFQRLNDLLMQSDGSKEESYWKNLFFNFLLHGITISFLCHREQCTVETISHVISSCPESMEAIRSCDDFMSTPFGQILNQAEQNTKNAAEARAFSQAVEFFLKKQASIGSRTRGIAITACNNVFTPFLLSPLYETVCTEDSIFTPELPLNQVCVVLDADVLTHQLQGLLIQNLIVIMTQEAALRQRNPKHYTMIVRDEAQLLIADPTFDMSVMSVARSFKLCHVSASQNIPLLVSSFGGDHAAEQKVKAILANYRTKFVLANVCDTTNAFFSEAFGKHKDEFVNINENHQQDKDDLVGSVFGANQFSMGTSQQLVERVPKDAFLKLRRGENGLVDAYMTSAGHTFDGGLPYKLVTFSRT